MGTPLHPQWLATRDGGQVERSLAGLRPGSRVLDLGCAGQAARTSLPAGCDYVGLDHPATSAAYGVRPMIYGDAHAVPCRDGCMDAVVLADVLEHLADPERALAEICRVLRPGGHLLLSVPFAYPLHDWPHDYTRWTEPGLRSLAARCGFTVTTLHARGRPLESAALLFNLGLARVAVSALRGRPLAMLLAPVIPPLMLVVNLLGYALGRLSGPDGALPYAYFAVWTRAGES